MAVADDEHEQQHRDDGCEKHPPYSRSNHSRVDVVAGFGCNTSQAHVAKQTSSGRADTVDAALNNPSKWTHQLVFGCFQDQHIIFFLSGFAKTERDKQAN